MLYTSKVKVDELCAMQGCRIMTMYQVLHRLGIKLGRLGLLASKGTEILCNGLFKLIA